MLKERKRRGLFNATSSGSLVAFTRGVTALAGFRGLSSVCTELPAIHQTIFQDCLAAVDQAKAT
jgi:hypothetical protein